MRDKENPKWLNFLHGNVLGRHVDSYLPWYDEYSDYNTNAKSYYDYLARYNYLLRLYADLINRLLRRNLETLETDTLELIKKGDWIDNGKCPPENFDDIIKLLGNVKVSNNTKNIKIGKKNYNLDNAIEIFKNGLYVADYKVPLEDIWKEINKIWIEIDKIFKILDKHDEKLKDHDDRLDDLEELIDSIRGINLKELVNGRDYELEFYNGFYSPEDDLVLSVADTKHTLDLHVKDHSTAGKLLVHDGDLRTRTEMSFRPGKDVPEKSKVFAIKFLGEYAYLNNLEVKVDNTQQVFWIIDPVDQRASWSMLMTAHNIGNKIVYSWRNFADGYGRQLEEVYTEPLNLRFGMVRSHIIFEKEGV